MGDFKRPQVSWHSAAEQARSVFTLKEKALKYFMNGDLGNWYYTLVALRMNINHDLNDTEIEDVDKLENDALKCIYDWQNYKRLCQYGLTEDISEELKNSIAKFSRLLKKYHLFMMDLLKQMGYYPDKIDRTNFMY